MNYKSLTPMKRLNGQFKDLNNLIGKLYDNITLNKAGSRRTGYGWDHSYTKGVQSDFISIFSPKNKREHESSFSFVFNYMESDTYFAQIKTGKENDSIITSKELNFDMLRLSLNDFLIDLKKVNGLTTHAVFEAFRKHFMREKISDAINILAESIIEFKNDNLAKEAIPELYETKKKLESKRTRTEKKIEKEYSELPEHAEIQELKNKIKALEAQLVGKKGSIIADNKLLKLLQEYSIVVSNIDKKERDVNKRVERKVNDIFKAENLDSSLKPIIWNHLKK